METATEGEPLDKTNEKLLQLPFSKIRTIMRLDPDFKGATQEAVFLIAKATVSTGPEQGFRLASDRWHIFGTILLDVEIHVGFLSICSHEGTLPRGSGQGNLQFHAAEQKEGGSKT